MMNFNFDLISDLHIETWSEEIDWTGIATSPVCVIVGDISKDRNIVTRVLTKLGQCYQAVFYIDGNDEHHDYLHKLGYSYADLVSRVNNIPNVVYLQDNVVVIVMEELGIIQQVSKELFRSSIVAMVKQTVITAAINMRPICGKPHVLHVRGVG
jgi:hypothetical protein